MMQHRWTYRAAALFLVAVGLLSPVAALAATVVFGSYTNPDYADEAARKAAAVLGIQPRLAPITVNGVAYLRLLAPAGLSQADAQALVEQARANGFESAWYLSEPATADPLAEAVAAQAREPALSPRTVPAKPPPLPKRLQPPPSAGTPESAQRSCCARR